MILGLRRGGMRNALSPSVNRKAEELKKRTAEFAKAIIQLCDDMPATQAGRRIGGQLIDAATSVNSNYRAACRARSRAEFIAKLGIVCEEADECYGWLDLLISSGLMSNHSTIALRKEADELTAIFTASIRTAKKPHRPAAPLPHARVDRDQS